MMLPELLCGLLCGLWPGAPPPPPIRPVWLPWILSDPKEWVCSRGSPAHRGDDRFAHDWSTRKVSDALGQEVRAGLSGLAAAVSHHRAYGTTIVLWQQATGLALRYAHLSEARVHSGEIVEAGGSVIGTVGDTGLSPWAPAHLHLSLYSRVGTAVGRPVTEVVLSDGAETQHAVPFQVGDLPCPTR